MAEPGDEKLHQHLKRHGLTDERWFIAFQRLNVRDPDNIKNKENMFALLSVMATASESVGLRKALGISSALAKVEKVDGILKEGRLESEYWSKVLSKQFGVVSAQGFSYIPQDISFPHLVQFARSFDEYKNIKELLRINDEEKEVFELYKKFMVGFRDRASEMKAMIDKIEQFWQEGKLLEDKEVQTMCSNALESMQVPKEFWLSVTAYETFLKSLHSFHNFIVRVPDKEKMLLPDSESVIQQSSNGLALKGVLILGSDEQQSLESITLAVPEGIELKLPIYPQHIKKVFCIGKDEEEEALKQVNNFKVSVIGSRRRVSSKKYCSTIKQFVVPLASCFFLGEQLRLSEKAVSKLKVIENSKVDLLRACENFLKEFGSHVCLGPFHFGGSYLWHCYTCDIKKQTDFVAAETLQKETIQFYGSLFEIPIHPTINEQHMSFPREILKRTYIKISTSGGMTHPTSVAHWRNHLMVNHKSWVLLDCGQEYYPIWDIVQKNHEKHFKQPSFVAKAVQAVWKKLKPNLPRPWSIETNDLYKKVHGWIKSPSINIQENLLFLVRQREIVTKERKDIKVWSKHYLTLPYVQKYVMLVVGKVSITESEELKGLLRQIVSPADIEYIKGDSIRAEVLRVVYKTDQKHAVMELKDIMPSVKLSFEIALGMFFSSTSDIEAFLECVGAPQTAMEATAIIKDTICYLKDHFERTCQVYDELFVDTLLFPFKYTTDHTYFYMRGRYDVECLSNLFQMYTKRFYEIKGQQSIVKLKAFLILLTIDICNNMGMNILSKTDVHLEMMYKHFIKDDLSDSVVETILSEIIENKRSFESANTALQHIILASSNEVEAVTENLDKVFSASSSGARLAPQPKLNDFELMLSFFHLAKYYPQKMTLLQALEVREGLVCDGQICSDHTVYALLIIQRIMAFDRRCFIRLVDSSQSSPLWHKVKKAKFINLLKSLQNKKIVTDINPLDGLVTVLLCADNFLRQELMWRLATCQIAIPLILPDPKTDILTLTLWAMRTIIKQWESIVQKKSYTHEVSIISYPTPIVSFVRFGCHKHSKSKLINVIMNDSYHDTFFNYDCDGGTAKKVAAQGLVDIAWYLPSTTNKAFHDAVAFVNLHGDARYFQRQVKFLSEISLMHFAFINEKDLDKEGCETLQTLSKAPGGAVILQTEKTTNKAIYKGYHVEVLKLEEKNEADTKTCIRKAISTAIQRFWCGKQASIHVLETCHAAARRCDIVVDEDDVSCAEGKRLADKFKLIIDSLGQTQRINFNFKERIIGKRWLKKKRKFIGLKTIHMNLFQSILLGYQMKLKPYGESNMKRW